MALHPLKPQTPPRFFEFGIAARSQIGDVVKFYAHLLQSLIVHGELAKLERRSLGMKRRFVLRTGSANTFARDELRAIAHYCTTPDCDWGLTA
jgi:hypothetical protein